MWGGCLSLTRSPKFYHVLGALPYILLDLMSL